MLFRSPMIIPPRLVAVLLAAAPLAAQNPTPEETRFQRFVRQSREAEAKGLAEPFRGITATGKTATHINSTTSCSSCHTTISWKPASKVDHTQVMGTCASCHNGSTATGKTATHIASTNACESCHVTLAFKPASRVDHTQVTGRDRKSTRLNSSHT